MSLALTILALVFLTELVSWIGQTVLLDIFYTLHQYLFNHSAVRTQRRLRMEILVTKQELRQTSAQDQFAKWAKLRRKFDKGIEDLEKLNNELAAAKASYSNKFNTAVWIATSGAQYGLGWWYGRQAVFYLPAKWFGPAEWWMSLLMAPMGSVSCGVWQMACKRVLKVGEGIVRDFAGPATAAATEPMSATSTGSEKAGSEKAKSAKIE